MEILGDSVEVAIQASDAFVRVHGRATFKIGPALKQFGMMACEKGCRRIIVEMQDCVGMDSTFMGVLAGLATQLKKIDGAVVLRNISDKNSFLIKMLGINHLVTIDANDSSTSAMPGNGKSLQTGADKQQMTQTMITAHEALIEAAPDNMVKFKDVLVYLKEDLARTVMQQTAAANQAH
ncbi:MAG: STAS domain-containing protein [bacterium]|jgi:anti-sigma B factor antagonist